MAELLMLLTSFNFSAANTLLLAIVFYFIVQVLKRLDSAEKKILEYQRVFQTCADDMKVMETRCSELEQLNYTKLTRLAVIENRITNIEEREREYEERKTLAGQQRRRRDDR